MGFSCRVDFEADGRVRICADFTHTISPVINTQLFPLPHLEEVFADLEGAKYFSN
ncbi:Putative LOC100494601 (Silurana) [Caligus rogercresseyi]|uniref:LOC100494601 (Silurana) n=1 Tax=Caligus rogercresseyi TaxID=217165 RepID=A0A7T8HJK8_CALRO|nr:Putative LOC100494601 (Silurana) [Caligus rogercresseyi]